MEGEGYIGLVRRKGSFVPTISVGQAIDNKRMLVRLKTLWGGCMCRAYKARPGKKEAWHWILKTRMAKAAIEELIRLDQFQGPKRIAAENILLYYAVMDHDGSIKPWKVRHAERTGQP